MYLFYKINNYFLGQNKEKDFIEIKEVIDNKEFIHLKDKSFSWDSTDRKFNFFLSENGYISMYFLIDQKPDIIESWENNDYSLPKYGITKDDIKPEKTFETLKSYYDRIGKKFCDKDEWEKNWEEKMKKDENLTSKIFYYFCLEKMVIYYKDKIPELLKEYDEIIEVHSISECIKKNMKYKLIDDTSEKNFSELKIFKDKINCNNIFQGYLGTCYFLSAISILSNYGQLLYQLFPQEEISDDGYYEICLYQKGKWYKVLIDDYFVFKKRKNENDPLTFYYSQPVKGCLYSCFLEKAYAKLNGSFADINGGFIENAFKALTGFDSLVFNLAKLKGEILEKYMKQFNIYLNKGYLIGGGSDGHEYSIIKTINELDFFVRNPWGSLSNGDSIENRRFGRNYKMDNYILNYKGNFRILKDRFRNFFDLGITVCFCLFGSKVYIYNLDNIGTIINDKFLYFSFKTKEEAKIMINLRGKNSEEDFNIIGKYSAKLINLQNNKIYNIHTYNDFKNNLLINNNFTDFDLENNIKKKGEYLLKINLIKKTEEKIKNILLSIIIDKNIDINFLGYLNKDPDQTIINNPSQINNQLESDNYFYGEKTAELFKKFQKVKKLMEKEGYELPNDLRGVYIETIFTDKIETMMVFDKSKRLKRYFTFDKDKKIFHFKLLDKDDKILKEKIYQYNEIIIPKEDISEKNFNIINIKEENLSLHTDRALNMVLDFEFQEDFNNSNEYRIEKKTSLFCGNNIYSMAINDYEFIFIFDRCLSNFHCGSRYLEIKYKSDRNEMEKNYGFVSKIGKCCLGNFNYDFFLKNNTETKYASLWKKNNCFWQNSIIEINNNLSEHFRINENVSSHNKSYEIYKGDNAIGNATQNSQEDRTFYEVVFNNGDVNYKDKILIIIGLILIIN